MDNFILSLPSLPPPSSPLNLLTFSISVLALFQGGVHEHLNKGKAGLLVEPAGHLSVLPAGRNEGAEGHRSGIGKQLPHLRHSSGKKRLIFNYLFKNINRLTDVLSEKLT
jgi:hypothetical protein